MVKRIFELAKNGHTVYQITMILKKDEILKPRAKMVQDFNRYASPKFLKYPYDWQTATIYSILGNREYLGHMISNRFTTRSFKDKRIVSIPQDQWIEVSNTHEAIIDQETFDIVQKIVSVKKPKKEPEIQHLFIGLLRCATCGHTLVFHKRAARNSIGCYNCSTYTRYGKGYCSAHYISYENVYNIVLKDIQKHAKLATSDSDRLTRRIMEISNHNCNIKKKQVEKDIIQFERRLNELNQIIKRLYEDNVIGKISDDRFALMIGEYETEHKTTKEKLTALKTATEEIAEIQDSSDRFKELIQKYLNIEELTKAILGELIEKIVVHDKEIIEGEQTQKIDIYYRFVGNMN